MKNRIFFVLIAILAMLAACSGTSDDDVIMPEGPSPAAASVAVKTVDERLNEGVSQTLLGEGEYINWSARSEEFLQDDGTYLVPVSYLLQLSGADILVFEGEFWNTIGVHHICTLMGEDDNQCPIVDGNIQINQGSFWSYSFSVNGSNADDVLMAFAHDKWMNWHEQNMTGNPIVVHLSTELSRYGAGVEPGLTDAQAVYVKAVAADRCPSGQLQVLETPYSDADDENDTIVVGAPGSYACRTLFVGKRSNQGQTVAIYWRGAQDGFSYAITGASFYLVPESWGENEMLEFIEKEFGISELLFQS